LLDLKTIEGPARRRFFHSRQRHSFQSTWRVGRSCSPSRSPARIPTCGHLVAVSSMLVT
jgi:hypothetical protein